MSERYHKEHAVAPYVLAGVGLLSAAGYTANKLLPPTPQQQAKMEAKEFTEAIASGQSVQVLENGSADVRMNDGKHYAHIENPVVTKTGHVIGRDKLTGKVVIYYKDDQHDRAAKEITFKEHGHEVPKSKALSDSEPVVLEIPHKVGNQMAYTAAEGQGFDGKPVAVATPEHKETITITKIVPDQPEQNG